MPISRRLNEKTYRRLQRKYVGWIEVKEAALELYAPGTSHHTRISRDLVTYQRYVAEIDEILATFK